MSVSFYACIPPDEKCGICWDDYRENRDAVSHTIGDVDHVFHRSCLENWSRERPVCPLCVRQIEMPQVAGPLIPTFFLKKVTSVALSAAGGLAAGAGLVAFGVPTDLAAAAAGGIILCGRIMSQIEGPTSTALATMITSTTFAMVRHRDAIGMLPDELISVTGLIMGLFGAALSVAVENN